MHYLVSMAGVMLAVLYILVQLGPFADTPVWEQVTFPSARAGPSARFCGWRTEHAAEVARLSRSPTQPPPCDDLFRQVRRGAPLASAAIAAPPIPAPPTTAPRPTPAAAAPCQSMVGAQQVHALCPWPCEVSAEQAVLC